MTKNLFAVLVAAALVSCATQPCNKELQREHSDAMEAAVADYIAAAAEKNLPVNTIMVLQHGKVLGEAYVNGWAPDSAHHMWSTSKSFTSMAVGFAVQEGKMTLDDKLVDYFPEESQIALKDISDSTLKENMLACTVKDLLVMGCGHEEEPAFSHPEVLAEKAGEMQLSGNLENMQELFDACGIHLANEFFKTPFVHKPGTFNRYNSPATYMLSVMCQKATGEKINDYLEPRLWKPLGIEKPFWAELDGANCGGWGLFITPETMAKTGQMLLDGGRYAGKQVFPEDYLKEAVSPWFKWGWPEWDPQQRGRGPHNGYGYQFWTFTEGFNTAGAQGQFILVFPELDAVVVCTAEIPDGDFQETDLIWQYIVPVLERETLKTVEIQGSVGTLRGDLRIPQEALNGEKVPMVIICHGLTASRNEPLLNGVAMSAQKAGMASVKFDFNGHGQSDGCFSNHNLLNEEEDLEKIYEWVKSLDYVDAQRIAVLGHSQGGAVVSLFAGRHTELGGLILCAPATLELQNMPWERIGDQMPLAFQEELPDSIMFAPGHYLGKSYILAVKDTDIAGELANYRGPVCIIHGGRDSMVPVSHAKAIHAILPQSELHVLPGLEHGFQPDEQQAIDVAADFLDRIFSR